MRRTSREMALTAQLLDGPQHQPLRQRSPKGGKQVRAVAKELVVLAIIAAVAFVGGVAVLAATHSRTALACCSSTATSSR